MSLSRSRYGRMRRNSSSRDSGSMSAVRARHLHPVQAGCGTMDRGAKCSDDHAVAREAHACVTGAGHGGWSRLYEKTELAHRTRTISTLLNDLDARYGKEETENAWSWLTAFAVFSKIQSGTYKEFRSGFFRFTDRLGLLQIWLSDLTIFNKSSHALRLTERQFLILLCARAKTRPGQRSGVEGYRYPNVRDAPRSRWPQRCVRCKCEYADGPWFRTESCDTWFGHADCMSNLARNT